jgi:hypothetical protein
VSAYTDYGFYDDAMVFSYDGSARNWLIKDLSAYRYIAPLLTDYKYDGDLKAYVKRDSEILSEKLSGVYGGISVVSTNGVGFEKTLTVKPAFEDSRFSLTLSNPSDNIAKIRIKTQDNRGVVSDEVEYTIAPSSSDNAEIVLENLKGSGTVITIIGRKSQYAGSATYVERSGRDANMRGLVNGQDINDWTEVNGEMALRGFVVRSGIEFIRYGVGI